MALNKQKGNMFDWVTHTWNIIKGICSHKCSYCYMKGLIKRDLYFDKRELKTDLGEGNVIFVGSSCDMWAHDVPSEWIEKTMKYLNKFPFNKYLFQTKNPRAFKNPLDLVGFMRKPEDKIIFGTTIETNREDLIKLVSNAPNIHNRVKYMSMIRDFKKSITIEPIMEFDLDELVNMIREINPDWVNIGADSKNHKLQEPSWFKVKALISELKKFTEVKEKYNLKRLKIK